MNRDEMRRVGVAVMALWPTTAWPDLTMKAAEAMFADLEFEQVRKAVTALAEEGREFAPPPGAVYALARTFQSERLALAPPDVTRDATPEELERARRWLPRLKAQLDKATRRL